MDKKVVLKVLKGTLVLAVCSFASFMCSSTAKETNKELFGFATQGVKSIINKKK